MWVQAMKTQISSDTPQNANTPIANPEIVNLVNEALAQFWEIRNEWSSSINNLYVRI
jgi:hypothetical protein